MNNFFGSKTQGGLKMKITKEIINMNNLERVRYLSNKKYTQHGITQGDITSWERLSNEEKEKISFINEKTNELAHLNLENSVLKEKLRKLWIPESGSKYTNLFRFLYVPKECNKIFKSLFKI